MHDLHDDDQHFNHDCDGETARENTKDESHTPEEFREGREVRHPPRQAEAANELCMAVEPATKHFWISVDDEDDAEHQTKREQSKWLKTI